MVIMSHWQHWPSERTGWALLLLLSILFCSHYKAEGRSNITTPFSVVRPKNSIAEPQQLPQPCRSIR